MYIFFGEMSFQILCSFVNWISHLLLFLYIFRIQVPYEIHDFSLLRVLTRNECWILSSAFSTSTELTFFFPFTALLITLVDFQVLTQTWTPGINSTWSWWILLLLLFLCCWIQFVKILFSPFASISIGLLFVSFLSFKVFVWFWCQGNADLMEHVRKYSLLVTFIEYYG